MIDSNDWDRIREAWEKNNPGAYPDRSMMIGDMIATYIASNEPQPDYRDLLRRYIAYITKHEGTNLLGSGTGEPFTAEEWATLRELAK